MSRLWDFHDVYGPVFARLGLKVKKCIRPLDGREVEDRFVLGVGLAEHFPEVAEATKAIKEALAATTNKSVPVAPAAGADSATPVFDAFMAKTFRPEDVPRVLAGLGAIAVGRRTNKQLLIYGEPVTGKSVLLRLAAQLNPATEILGQYTPLEMFIDMDKDWPVDMDPRPAGATPWYGQFGFPPAGWTGERKLMFQKPMVCLELDREGVKTACFFGPVRSRSVFAGILQDGTVDRAQAQDDRRLRQVGGALPRRHAQHRQCAVVPGLLLGQDCHFARPNRHQGHGL